MSALPALGDPTPASPPSGPTAARPLSEPERRGGLSIADRVVEKIAAQAASEVPQAAGVPHRVLGQSLGRPTEGSRPRASARIDGSTVTLSLSMSVGYPTSVRQVAAGVRERVIQRVHELCTLEVVEVDITVPRLLTRRAAPPRVV